MRKVGLILFLSVGACSSSPSSSSSSHFAAAVTYATGGDPYSMSAADVNGDGNLDIVVNNQQDSTVGVFIGKGDGTFAPQVTYASMSFPRISVADFNHDGHPDILVASMNGLGVLLNSGTGTFGAVTSLSTANTGGIAAADFDGDGYVDLAVTETVASLNTQICIYLNNQTGGVQTPVCETLDAGGTDIILGSGTIEGDILPSVFVSDMAGTISSFGYYTDNGGMVGGGQMALDPNGEATSIAVADFNLDGRADVVVGDGQLKMYLAVSNGAFSTATTYANQWTWEVVTGFLNSDAYPDIVTLDSTNDKVNVLYGDGKGGIASEDSMACGNAPAGSLLVGDFNGDGHPDIAVANNADGTIGVYISKW